ncbi:MAG: FAD-dependent oxidoreductase [Dehalococcoidia bacterium]|nr:FAD-dependent oxidoreductase [Dehalococcoidia bacterium]
MTRERVIVIGGDAAGMSAASQAKRQRPDLDIVAFERGGHTSYSACGMPYYVGALIDEADELIARTPDGFRKQGIDARIFHEVIAIDTRNRTVTVRRLQHGDTITEPYDQLVIATGATPVTPNLPGADAAGIFTLSILQDGITLRETVDRERPKSAVVVGGGYIGLEVAEALVIRGLDVTMIEALPEVLNILDPDMAALVSQATRDFGVHLFLNEPVIGFETRNGRAVAVTTANRTVEADLIVVGIGVRPNTALAAAAGVPLGVTGGIKVDRRMRTEVDGVWAAGDCVESTHLVSGQPVHVALGTVANKQGRILGINLGGGYQEFPGVLGTAITKIGEVEIARTGLNEREAQKAGLAYVVGKVSGTSRAGYYPHAGMITIKVLAENPSGRMLGAQIVGTEGAGKRIDTFATAIQARLTVDEFQYYDLSYAPPFSPVWDTPLIAARKAVEALRGR